MFRIRMPRAETPALVIVDGATGVCITAGLTSREDGG